MKFCIVALIVTFGFIVYSVENAQASHFNKCKDAGGRYIPDGHGWGTCIIFRRDE